MSCDIVKGRLEPCKDSVGGIKELYFANYQIHATINSDDEITDLSTSADSAVAVTLFKYEVKGATNLEQTTTSSRDTGTTFWSQVLNATFKKLDASTQKELKLMAYGRPQVVVVDYNGNAFLCGMEHGMEVTGGTIVTGTAMGDLSGFTIALTGNERYPANFLDGSTDANPFAGLTTAPTITVGT
jgi:hypothetical protein